MNSASEWCTDKLSKLLNEELRITTLNEIRDHFTAVSSNEAYQTANLLELPLVFDCLNDSNSEQIDLACEVLSLCMTNLNIGESTNKYSVPLERALNHPYANVKLMALTELERYITDDDSMLNLCKTKNLLNSIIKCINDNELSVASKSMKIVTKIGQSDTYIKYLIAEDTIQTIKNCIGQNEVIRLRFYEVFIDIAKVSEGHLNLLVSSGLLSKFLEELDSNDILLLMNILELLSKLVVCNHGYKFLENRQVLNQMFTNEDPLFQSTCGIGALKLFGALAHWKPREILYKYNNMTNKMFLNLDDTDLTLIGITLDTIAFIGESNTGKLALDSFDNKMFETFEIIKRRIISFPTPLCIRTLNCIENLIRIIESDARTEEITKKWFDTLDNAPMDFILKYAKNPFGEIRCAGLGVLISISKLRWGQQYIKNTPGLIEFLLDRSSESIKDCKQAKYDVILNLATGISVFDQNTLNRLQTFIREGPYYVQTVMEIAVEGND